MTERRRLVVRGRVQGVGFRWFVRETARRCGLAGWVRNLADGSVELEASGPPDMLALLAEAVRAGPPGADVTSVDDTTDAGDDGVQVLVAPAHPFAILK